MAKAQAGPKSVAEAFRSSLKGRRAGLCEAIVPAMAKIGNDEVRVQVLNDGVGAMHPSTDVGLAEPRNAPINGFNVRANCLLPGKHGEP